MVVVASEKVKIEIDVEVALFDAELALSIALCLLGKQYTTTRRILLEACGLASIDAINSAEPRCLGATRARCQHHCHPTNSSCPLSSPHQGWRRGRW